MSLARGDACIVVGDGWTAAGVVEDDASPVSRQVRYAAPGEAERVDWFDHEGGLTPPGKRLADPGKPPVRIRAGGV